MNKVAMSITMKMKKESTANAFKPAWGKAVIKEKVEIDDSERIRTKKGLDKNSLLYNVDVDSLPLTILERKIEAFEGQEDYKDNIKTIASMKKYLKQKEVIEAENLEQARIQAEQRANILK
jgi:hypothetical protein